MTEKPTLYCSFCRKSQHAVRRLIAGPKDRAGVASNICEECVWLCAQICTEECVKAYADDHLRDIRENGT